MSSNYFNLIKKVSAPEFAIGWDLMASCSTVPEATVAVGQKVASSRQGFGYVCVKIYTERKRG